MGQRQRVTLLGILIVSLVLAGLAGTPGTARAAAGALGAVPATKIVSFHPSGTPTQVVNGNCGMGESLALDRADAWRCMVGNEIYDPCFSDAPHATSVICDATPMKPTGIRVKLSAPLPTHGHTQGKQAWILELGDGTICGFLTGATGGVADQRLNYGCTADTYVIGDPQPVGKVWYATEVTVGSQFTSQGPKPLHIFAISIATIWK